MPRIIRSILRVCAINLKCRQLCTSIKTKSEYFQKEVTCSCRNYWWRWWGRANKYDFDGFFSISNCGEKIKQNLVILIGKKRVKSKILCSLRRLLLWHDSIDICDFIYFRNHWNCCTFYIICSGRCAVCCCFFWHWRDSQWITCIYSKY